MKNRIVCDAGPLIAFAKIDFFSQLQQIFNTIIIPSSVNQECLIDMSRPGAIMINNMIKKEIIRVKSDPVKIEKHLQLALGKGEAAAISLALEQNQPLIIDDKLGREAAEHFGVKIIGVAGILLLTKKKGIIKKVEPYITHLKEQHYHISQNLIEHILSVANERESR